MPHYDQGVTSLAQPGVQLGVVPRLLKRGYQALSLPARHLNRHLHQLIVAQPTRWAHGASTIDSNWPSRRRAPPTREGPTQRLVLYSAARSGRPPPPPIGERRGTPSVPARQTAARLNARPPNQAADRRPHRGAAAAACLAGELEADRSNPLDAQNFAGVLIWESRPHEHGPPH